MKKKLWAGLAVGVMMCGMAGMASATVIYQENFESYGENTNLSGQGGWTGEDTRVATGSDLSTMVSNGLIDPGTGYLAYSTHVFSSPLSSSLTYTLSYDAFAYSTGPRSSDAGVYFTDSSTSFQPWGAEFVNNNAGWFMASNTSNQWEFDVRLLTGNDSNVESFTGGYDTVASFQVILDPTKGEVYGRADLGSGHFETTHYSMTDSQFATINGVMLHQDYRSPSVYRGAEFDNILVESAAPVPEPATMLLMGTGLAGLIGARRKKK